MNGLGAATRYRPWRGVVAVGCSQVRGVARGAGTTGVGVYDGMRPGNVVGRGAVGPGGPSQLCEG